MRSFFKLSTIVFVSLLCSCKNLSMDIPHQADRPGNPTTNWSAKWIRRISKNTIPLCKPFIIDKKVGDTHLLPG